ncbi:MAG: transglycosylase SLT domain-containing protein [Rhodobacterales bacterium]|nr:transglycosylase SLT domain-containing protein [Rhodobacterales bacterium]
MRITILAGLAGLGLGLGILCPAPDSARAEDFTFRRVAPPEAGTTRRITVQIDPEEQARRLAALPRVDPEGVTLPDTAATPPGPLTPVPAPPSGYAWFWDRVSPLQADRQGRFDLALASLSQGPGGQGVTAPRLQLMQEIAARHGPAILAATIGTEVSPALALAVIGVESAGQTAAVSSTGAVGLMQLIPDTAARFGVTDSTDPVQNIRGGVAYLDWLMKRFDRDPLMVLAAYNSGEGAVEANAGVPPYAETRDYVPKVLAAWQVAQGLCLTAPELVTDPCVFRVASAGG